MLRARAWGYDACEDLLSEILLLRPSMDLFHRFAVPLPRARGRLRELLRWLFCRRARARAEGCIPPGGAQRLPAAIHVGDEGA